MEKLTPFRRQCSTSLEIILLGSHWKPYYKRGSSKRQAGRIADRNYISAIEQNLLEFDGCSKKPTGQKTLNKRYSSNGQLCIKLLIAR